MQLVLVWLEMRVPTMCPALTLHCYIHGEGIWHMCLSASAFVHACVHVCVNVFIVTIHTCKLVQLWARGSESIM